MDRNSIIGIILIAGILILYSVISKPSREEAAERQRITDSLRIEQLRAEEETRAEMSELEEAASDIQPSPAEQQMQEETEQQAKREQYGVFASSVGAENEFYILENDKVILKISKEGGKPYSVELKEYQTYDSLPLILFEGDENIFGLEFFADGRTVRTDELMFDNYSGDDYMLAENEPKTLVMRLPIDGGDDAYLEYSYTLNPGQYFMGFNVRMKNMDQYRTDNVQLKWEISSPQQERGRQNEENYTTLFYRFYQGDVEKFRSRSKKEMQEVSETTRIHWVGYKQQFFSNVILSDQLPFEDGYMRSERLVDSEEYLFNFSSELGIPYDRTSDFRMPMHFYFGPNDFQRLKGIGYELQNLVTVGGSIIRWINAYVIINLFNWLDNFIGSYGIIILLLTIIIKLALLPLTFRSYMSQAKMRALKPEIDELGKKFPKEKAMEKQQATMALYKKAGVNPMGGCLPILLQMPILYAMFRFFPASIELRQESFLWANDLSTYDSILQLPFTIPMYGDHVSLFTLLMTVSTILSMKMNSGTTGAESQMPGMKGMMYIMPVMFMLILNNFSAGLTYYYFLANLITIGQNYIFKQFIDEEKLRKKLHAKKAKPAKKSNFQKRLEDAAKHRGYNLPKK